MACREQRPYFVDDLKQLYAGDANNEIRVFQMSIIINSNQNNLTITNKGDQQNLLYSFKLAFYNLNHLCIFCEISSTGKVIVIDKGVDETRDDIDSEDAD